jgi:hypothetical protein
LFVVLVRGMLMVGAAESLLLLVLLVLFVWLLIVSGMLVGCSLITAAGSVWLAADCAWHTWGCVAAALCVALMLLALLDCAAVDCVWHAWGCVAAIV